ncbi:MAG: rod shape-determining protein MreC [Chitinophagaceae bacterium]|jgi:rod shape-determining protein MreC|nr:rod shape-determining protein MreC [Chitinophagaceae bacterium]
MRNIFLFIRRYFNLLTFLLLQFVALYFLFNYNRFHRASFLGIANEITGNINSRYDKLDDYFHQGEENRRVHRMNDSLLNLLEQNYLVPDTGMQVRVDTLRGDTIEQYRRYLWREAKVINNAVNRQRNYLQLNRGAKHGIRDNMAVLNSDGSVVGVVVNVSSNFSQVMSLLHVQSKVNASLKKTKEFGSVEWDAVDPRYLLLKGIPKNEEIVKGDTVLTSVYSYNFPPDHIIGTVNSVTIDKATGLYLIKVATNANFYNLQQVFVVENLHRSEQVLLDEETRKKIDEVKPVNR